MRVVAPASKPRRRGRALPTRSDADVIAACLQGRREAWDELVDRYSRLVYSVARRLGLSDQDADDAFQNTFAILYQKLESVRDHERLPAWVIRTTRRECIRVAARAGRHAALDEALADGRAASDEEASDRERQHLVRQALRRLGGRCAALLTALFLVSGPPSYEAIADELGMKVGSIGPTRARCFEKLEKIFLEMGFGADSEGG